MKKSIYLLFVAFIATGCATGYYAPHNVNQFGAQTQVVLDQANFRIVRHLEVVIDVNNTNLKRADVEKSAYAELLRRANLTGSQALVNVVIEEVRRESMNIFRVLFSGLSKVTQHVAARATIIEFLDNSGNPIQSVHQQGTAPRVSAEQYSENVVKEIKEEKIQEEPEKTVNKQWSDLTQEIATKAINKQAVDKKYDLNEDGVISEAELDEIDRLYKKAKSYSNWKSVFNRYLERARDARR